MEHVLGLDCLVCGERHDPGAIDYVCPRHGEDGIVDVAYDYPGLRAAVDRDALSGPGMWRYRPLLPLEPPTAVPPILVGATPMHEAPRLARATGTGRVWVKDEGRQPTASLKDRASAMAVAKAAEAGARVITTSSTGNAAAALAGICASVGMANVIFVPASAPPAKVTQLLAYGSTVLLVDGVYDDAVALAMRAAATRGWYNRTTGFNPYMSEGKKTASYEIAEDLGWQAPDAVFVSVGDGCIIGGVHKGFADLVALGWIDRMPRIYGVQAAGSAYLADAWSRGEDVLTKPPIQADTVADSISAGLPRDRIKALRAVEDSEGAFVVVSDDQILAAIPAMARGSGVFGEPAGAAAYAGLVEASRLGLVGEHDRVVVLNTGSGLKDVASARAAAEAAGAEAVLISADVAALDEALDRLDIPNEPGGGS
ncbi:MAG: threonine synthase [Actinobacteria bacterium]|nr:threonine synthase [Actinomycetota bacterium]